MPFCPRCGCSKPSGQQRGTNCDHHLLLLGAGAAWGARVRARLERVHRRFGGEPDVPRSVGAALGLAALAAAAAGVAVAA